ncbi:(R)-NAD(P)H-hydrate epimerase and ADP-dependent (S)-NAD(P)H-hydrate dehydratase [Geotalea daltonii FRC-32]|uniref:Bifunctional NAD(P)H-hydrate repair enzyme n=1 Tax=Geotalea daltonii (strain DSM 22248 / JCM 15807 / FRC-32) TaxID=316067 RepID=B9M2T9_GEODF|nr:bifunctional ADP-dependent NAD(P)H-hydrate dehydratase/NAD(P)H-hydrate epimerase [Geotalea daltonii]ACM21285.1 (R)-NAD(P)H-hydrate epimerase and ADP-dependent (S)-NAD(P)H-hydrate dehydratase [Geotalea daltonii FRC-32]
MKAVTGETMQQLDRRTIDELGISGLILMENAGRCCAGAITAAYGGNKKVVIVAGKGNNGGDGFVIARLLSGQGWQVRVFILCSPEEITGDAAVNLQRLDEAMITACPRPGDLAKHGSAFAGAGVIVDAILGTGLKSEVRGVYAEAIDLVNSASAPVFAVDIPSGVDSASGKILGKAVRADMTVTFAAAKLGCILYPGAELCGTLQVADIGIPEQVIADAPGCEFMDHAAARKLLRPRGRQTHKGQCGHCLIVAGSSGKTGAAAMAANSAVRAGAGLVTVAVPALLNPTMEIKTTEAMSLPVPDGGTGFFCGDAFKGIMTAAAGKDVIAVGPGLSFEPETADLVRKIVSQAALPLVVDADGLNAIAAQPEVLQARKSSVVILTPHPGEMARLAGITVADVEGDRIGVAKSFSSRYKVFLILKGARTIIASPDGEIAINGSGNPGMASGGMGDVLTGVVTALVGQGYPPFFACCLGTFIHGLSGDLVATEKGEIGISAVDVQESLPYAFKTLLSNAMNGSS